MASGAVRAKTWRPGWLICIQSRAPFTRPAAAQSLNGASGWLASRITPAGPVTASGATMTLPVTISPAPPSAHCR